MFFLLDYFYKLNYELIIGILEVIYSPNNNTVKIFFLGTVMLESKNNEGLRKVRQKRTSIKFKILVVLVAAIISAGIIFSARQFLKSYSKHSASTGESGTIISKPSMGGSFSLINQYGKKVTDKDFLGGYSLIFFGYTYCPDVCPTALTSVSDALNKLGELGEKITPIFITIDPIRDTVDHLKEYASFFHPRLVALTGTEGEIKAVAKKYRVYYAKAKENKEDPEDYLMDHSAITYLMGPNGKFVAHFSHGLGPELLAKRIEENLGE